MKICKIACYFLLLFGLASSAQEKKIEIDFNVKKSSIGFYETYAIFNKERDKVCILAVGSNDIKGYILDKDYKLLKEFEAGKLPVNMVLAGGYFTGDKVHFLLGENKEDNDLKYYIYDPASGKNDFSSVNLEIKKSMVIGTLSLGDQFLYFSVKKKQDVINIYRFGKNSSFELLQFAYDASGIGEESLFFAFSGIAGFSRSSEISCISDWEVPSMEKAKNYCKLYFRNDSVFITMDKSTNQTRILELDLNSKKISSREIKRTFDNYKDRTYSYTSFLSDNYLYSVVCYTDLLQLTVHDFYNGNTLKQYKSGKDEEITFRNTDIIQEGSDYFSDQKRKLENTKQLLRKMTNGRAMIIVRKAGLSEVELTIGSYSLVRHTGGGGMWMAGPPGAPSIYVPMGGFSREWIKSARFKTLLNINDFEKTNGEIEVPLEEKIEKYTKGIKIPEGCEGIYPVGNQLAYYYLDKKAKKIVVSSL